MVTKVNSEFLFTKKIGEIPIALTLYIDHINKTYDFMQKSEEGIFPSRANYNTSINKAYFELGLEVLDFVEKELYT